MTHHDDASTFADVLAHFGDDGTKDLFRRVLEQALQGLIDAGVTARIGAGRHERTESRSNYRNGHRDRDLSTPAGDLESRIPKLRAGSFFPSLLEPRRRVDKALWVVIMTAYISVASTRKVDGLVKALGCDTGVSESTVGRICTEIDEQVDVFRIRPLDHLGLPYVYWFARTCAPILQINAAPPLSAQRSLSTAANRATSLWYAISLRRRSRATP